MRLSPAQRGSLLIIHFFTASALQFPFKIPTFDEIKSKFNTLELPNFVRKITDPVGQSPLLSLHKSLVEIPSVTGQENAVTEWLANYLISKNYTVETQVVSGDETTNDLRRNIYAYIGNNRNAHTLVTSHIDTVPPFIPYKETSSIISGRGSNDAKGSVAAQITAIEELRAEDAIQEGDVSLLFVVGEETCGDGMVKANELGLELKTVIFGEPTELKLAVGHKGIVEFEVVAEGRAAHSGYPHLGISAISNLIKALYMLDNLQLPTSKLLGDSTLNIGQMEGGVAANVVPAHAKAVVAVRVAGDLEDTVRTINDAIANVDGVEIAWLKTPHYGPVELDHDVEGFQKIACAYGTDVPYLKGNHKKYLYGPGSILTAHGDNEHVSKSDLYEAVLGYKALVKASLNRSKMGLAPLVAKEAQSLGEEIAEVGEQLLLGKVKEQSEGADESTDA